jgi:hypothetical protein
MLRRRASTVLVLCLLARPVVAQTVSASPGLKGKIQQLFVFGDCGEPLCLVGLSAAHGRHFIPAVTGGSASVISFLTEAVGLNVANVPVSATSSGATFTFEGGLPVKTSVSGGPVFAERAQTMGKRRLLTGFNVTTLHFSTLRGVPLSNLQSVFTHQNVGDDSLGTGLGNPEFENDVINVKTAINLNLMVTTAFITYGLFDHVDIGVAVPYVWTSFRGSSTAQINPFGGPTAFHRFGGTPDDPVLRAAAFSEGSATGIGDVAARVKINISQNKTVGFSVLGDARFPTGDAENLLGSGATSVRGLGIVSIRIGDFSPHINSGFLYHSDSLQNHAFIFTAGFDQLLAPWATFAFDLLSEKQIGDSKLQLPAPVTYILPFRREVDPTTIPNRRDDVLNASVGTKFTFGSGTTLVTNAIIPLNRGGLRPDATWTMGLEYAF